MKRNISACMKFTMLIALCHLLLLAAANHTVVNAQGTSAGRLTGVARDEAGAIVPGARVTATNVGTNASLDVTTDAEGIYTLRAVPVGTYTVTVEAPGFKKIVSPDVIVNVNEDTRFDPSLTVGAVSEEVTVTGQTTQVDTTTPTLKNVIDERRIVDLPLNGRNAASLVLLVPGAQLDPNSSLTSGTTYPGSTPISSNGSRGNTINYVLDGGSNNDHYNNLPNPLPNPDALQEFSVQTNNFSAEYGRNTGAVVNAVTKSGTNEFHGSLFEYLRNNALNANNFFTPGRDDGLKRNQFGATIGGPLHLPRFGEGGPTHVSGRDRTFFFFSYQGTRTRQRPSDQTALVPTAAQRNGDFSALLRRSTPLQLRNPFTGQPFANNQIPVSLFNPVSARLLNNYIPTTSDAGGLTRFGVPGILDDDQYMGRVDHQFSSSNRLFGRLWFSKASQPPFLDEQNYLASGFGRTWRNTVVALNDTHIFSPKITNSLVLTFNRMNNDNFHIYPPSLQSLGSNIYSDDAPQIQITVNGYFGINTGDTNTFLRDEYQLANTTRIVAGSHNLSFGGDYSYGKGDIVNNFRANGQFTFAPGNSAGTGDALADFLIGKFSAITQGIGEYKYTRIHAPALFIQDEYRASQRLTLSLGLRWDPFIPYTDAQNRLAAFRPGVESPTYVNAPLGLVFPGDPGVPEGGFDASLLNFGPRVGFAYDVFGDGRTSVRGGYGIFFDRPNSITTNSLANNAPFGTVVSFTGNAQNSLSDPYAGRTNPFPSPLNPPSNVAFPQGLSVFSYDPDFRNAYLQSWNLSLERQFLQTFVLRTAYAGSKGTNLGIVREFNPAIFGPGATTANTNQRRPYGPTFSSIATVEPSGSSTYHALQVNLDKRLSRGLTLLSSYTWSKSIDDGSENKFTGIGQSNPFNRLFDRGPSNFDVRHRFTLATTYALPRFSNNVVNTVFGNYNLTGILTLQSGLPFTVASGVDTALVGTTGGQRPVLLRDLQLNDDRPRGEQVLRWFDTTAFGPAPAGTFGNVGRNSLRGPGYKNVDLGLHRNFPITENVRVQFRAEAFNVFNFVNLGLPNSNRSSSNFGRILTASDPRILQFALRLNF